MKERAAGKKTVNHEREVEIMKLVTTTGRKREGKKACI